MNSSMISAAVSMSGLQKKIDLVANNVSNVHTVGYKRQDASFFDLLTSVKQQEEGMMLDGRRTPNGLTLDWGSALSQPQLDFAQGSLVQTDQPLDLAIEGNALLEIAHVRMGQDGQPLLDEEGMPILDRLWTRNGSLKLTAVPGDDESLYLSTQDGHFVRDFNDELLLIPAQHRIEIDTDGNVWAYPNDLRVDGVAGEEEDADADSDVETEDGVNVLDPIFVGQLKIAHIHRPQMIESIGGGWFRVANAANIDEALEVVDLNERNEQTESIQIRQGFLEQSNVDLSHEMMELVTLQRSLQFNSRALASADEMMSLTNKLRG